MERRRRAGPNGKLLAKRWNVSVMHALYRETGDWYHQLERFPGGLFDADGYVLFSTELEFRGSPYLHINQDVGVPGGIKTIPGYVRMVPVGKTGPSVGTTVNHEARAFLAWPILVECAVNRSTITYEELGHRIGGVHQRAIGRTLGPIQTYCMDRLPPITVLVVSKAAGRPGGGFVAADDHHAGMRDVFDFRDWGTLPNPFEYAADSAASCESLAAELLGRPGAAADVFARVRVRGIAQQIFRDALLRAYDHACAFCGLTFTDALQAAHIVPWADCAPEKRLDPRNGMLLCATHHALFDAGFLAVDERFRILHVDPKNPLDTYSRADLWFTRSLHGRKMTLPDDEAHWPGLDYLQTRKNLR